MEGPAQEAASKLQQLQAAVVFFMPPWLDQGKDLLPYMEEILSLLRLPSGRIWILQSPLRFRHLLIPASVWGFGTKPQVLDQRLGCDTRALMRHLFAHCAIPPAAEVAPGPSIACPSKKVYVSRSSLPTGLGRLMGDVVLDPLLAEAGYRVFHPERCSTAEQIRLYSQANDLIFMDGSSIYLLWFAKLRPGTRVRLILRRRQGRWMAEKLLDLLPEAGHIRWELVDALRDEALTSTHEWQSHNVADLASLQRQLGRNVPAVLPKAAEEALTAYTHTLVQESTPEQLARVLQALLTTLATAPPLPPSRRQRLYRRVRGLLATRRG
ncbi:MAG: glycosyltransferase 61 family protein [Cyanobium sp.]